MKKIFIIPEFKLDKIEKFLQKSNRKATRYGFPEISFQIKKEFFKEIAIYNKEEFSHRENFKFFEIEVEGEIPSFNGWNLIAILEYQENGENIVKRNEKYQSIDISKYYFGNKCEHCGFERNRKTTVLIINQNNEIKQVGKSCLLDFTNTQIEKYIDNWQNIDQYFLDEEKEESFGSFLNHGYFETKHYMAYVAMSIRKRGYVSTQNQEIISTRDDAFNLMAESERPSKEDKEIVEASIEWTKSLKDSNDYERNIRILGSQEMVSYNNLGYVASIIQSYIKSKNIKSKSGEFIGTVGKKFETELKFISERKIANSFYNTSILNFEDKNGNIIIWFTSSNLNIPEGFFKATMTIKNHNVYDGQNQTVINRLKILV